MSTLAGLVLVVVTIYAAAKAASMTWFMFSIILDGSDIRRLLVANAPHTLEIDLWILSWRHFRSHPVEHRLKIYGAKHPRAAKLLDLLYTVQIVVIISSLLVVLLAASANQGWVSYALLAAGSACAWATFQFLLLSVARNLILGVYDVYNADLVIPSGGRTAGWGYAEEESGFRSIYFLSLAICAVLGFAALDAALAGALKAFTVAHPNDPLEWIYFSVVTIATVGYGDISPTSLPGEFAVVISIASGPLLFGWLIAVLLAGRPSAGRPASLVEPMRLSDGRMIAVPARPSVRPPTASAERL